MEADKAAELETLPCFADERPHLRMWALDSDQVVPVVSPLDDGLAQVPDWPGASRELAVRGGTAQLPRLWREGSP